MYKKKETEEFIKKTREVHGDKREKIQSEQGVHWIDIRENWDIPSKSSMTFVDLFCGAGGLSKGLEQAGLNGVCVV